MYPSSCSHFQDFVRLPWQNQSSQSSHSILAGSSSSSGAPGLASAFGSGSEQLNVGYSSTPGNLGLEAVSRSLDMASDAIESNSAAVPRYLFYFQFFVHYSELKLLTYLTCVIF